MIAVESEEVMPTPKSRMHLPYLRAWRLQAQLTQEGLAKAAGIGEATVVRAESNGTVNALTAARIADALEVSPDDLLRIPHQQAADNYIIELGTRRSLEEVQLIVAEAERVATDSGMTVLTRVHVIGAIQALIRAGSIAPSD